MFIQQTFVHDNNADPKTSTFHVASVSQNALDFLHNSPSRQLIVPSADESFEMRLYLGGSNAIDGEWNSFIRIWINENITDASELNDVFDYVFPGYVEEDHLIFKSQITEVCEAIPQALS